MSEGRVETVTVMFTDIVGSTEQRARVGEDEAERLRSTHDAILDAAVRTNDGSIVKHLGDGIMATFTGTANAVAAAVGIQQQIDLHNRNSSGERLSLRIGISAGDVTVDADDYFGLPVVEAQRLEGSAEPGTIRCAEMVKHLTRGRGDHEFVDLGDLELKGLPEPLSACEISWTPLAAAAPAPAEDLPPVLSLAGGMPFSGRSAVLEELVTAAKHCATGGFATVLLAGEPGIGKTRLAHELARRIQADGGLVLAGRCDEDVAVPYQAIRAALEWFIESSDAIAAEDLGRFSGDLQRLIPDLASRIDTLSEPLDAEPEAERYRLLQAVEAWLTTQATERPALLVIDDLHWADKPTLLVLQHLIATGPSGLMILCTYRDTDVDRTHALSSVLADLRRTESVTRIALEGLPTDDVREFLERAGGHELDEQGLAFAEIVERETAGNPFFVSELLRHLTESGLLVREGDHWTGDLEAGQLGVPEGIREVVGRRLGRLGDDVEDVLRAAAVIGYEFHVELLGAVIGGEIDDTIDALDTAAEANLVVEVGVDRYRFSHALVRETLHAELSSTRRARQHRKVAEALESIHGTDDPAVLSDLATHWREATVGGDPTRAVELAMAAGEQALGAAAPENAVRWFDSALELIDDEPSLAHERRVSLVRLAVSQVHAGDQRHIDTMHAAAAEAIDATDAALAIEALTMSARTSFSEANDEDPIKIELLRSALADLDLTLEQRADLTGELAMELIFTRDIAGRADAIQEFDELRRQLPTEVAHQMLADNPGRISFSATPERIEEMRHLLAGFKPNEISSGKATLQINLLFSALALGDRADIDPEVDRWTRYLDAHDAPFTEALSITWRVPLLVLEGDLRRAESEAVRLLGIMESLNIPEAFVYQGTTSLGTMRERGILPKVLAGWQAAAATSHPSSATASGAAFIEVVAGEHTAAAERLKDFVPAEVADDGGKAMAIGLMAEVAATLGTPSQCSEFCTEIEPLQAFHAATGGLYLGAYARLLALLCEQMGETGVADTHFGAAVEMHEAMRSPTWVARTHLDWAEALFARDEADRANTSLDAAEVALGDLDLPESRSRLATMRAL